jgi:penicillin-binding protein 1A
MSDVYVDTQAPDEDSSAPIPFAPPKRRRRWRRGPDGRPPKPRVRKLRLLLILVAFGTLAVISTVFGMMMAVASDLPQIENVTQDHNRVNSYLYDDQGRPIGIFAGPTNTVIDGWPQISQSMIHAVVAIEDKRFWTDPGVDIRGIARAFLSDVTGGQHEGASTIAEQFVKNVLGEENNRTVFEKLREAALAYQLTRRWKRVKILTQYLNTVYFGSGAYGIESAARVYFGALHGYDASSGPDQPLGACGDTTPQDPHRPKCAWQLEPWESALLAGMIANPTEYNPFTHPVAAETRRNLVLQDMYQQRYITYAQYQLYKHKPLPTAADLQQPSEPPAAPYFTSWLRPQIIHAVEQKDNVPANIAEYRAFYGGLKIRTTIDLPLQQAAQQAIDAEFPPGTNGPTAALVAIDNKTGEVRAMVSGDGDWNQSQFNLAADGHRQPGSSFKVFTLAEALATGEYGPDSLVDSAPQDIPFKAPKIKPLQHFIVHNFGNTYSGPITLQEATAISDNTVFAQVGVHVGTQKIKHMAKLMGIRSPISTNPSMILGGLHTGVSALDMAHAYETLATGGLKVFNPVLGDSDEGPIGIQKITCGGPKASICGGPSTDVTNHPTSKRVLSPEVAATERSMLEGVVGPGGTAPLAAIPGVVVFGKTGTTSNYVDAWFVGSTPQMTTAVWVGYPNNAVSMATNYNGAPVEGGTFPAIIWNDFMTQALQILANEAAAQNHGATGITGTSGSDSGVSSATDTATTPATAPSTGTTGTGTGGNTGNGNRGNTGTGNAPNTGTGNGGNTGTGNGGNTGTGNGGNTGTGNGGNTGNGNGGTPSGGSSPSGSGGAGLGGGGGGTGTGTANGANNSGTG